VHSPLNSPLHHAVRRNKWRHDVENLVPRPPNSVPCSLGEPSGKGTLPVRAHGVDDRAFAGLAAAFVGVAPAADVPSTQCTLAVPSPYSQLGIVDAMMLMRAMERCGPPRWVRSGVRETRWRRTLLCGVRRWIQNRQPLYWRDQLGAIESVWCGGCGLRSFCRVNVNGS